MALPRFGQKDTTQVRMFFVLNADEVVRFSLVPVRSSENGLTTLAYWIADTRWDDDRDLLGRVVVFFQVVDTLVAIFVLLCCHTRTVIEPSVLFQPRQRVDDSVRMDDESLG